MTIDLNSLRAIVARMDYDFSQFTPASFSNWVSQYRGRPIHLTPWADMPKAVFGIWFTYREDEFVFYDENILPVLQTVTILHELSHIYLNHTTQVFPNQTALQAFLQMLKRGQLSEAVALQQMNPHISREEQEAEMMAILLHGHIEQHRQVEIPHSLSPGADYLKAMGVL